MAEKNELMTIKAFASASGRSQQAIYKQISTRLSAYLHEIEGQKFIERRALFEVFGIGEEVELVAQVEEAILNRKKSSSGGGVVSILERTVAMLEEELKIKNKQIEDLTAANKELAQSINADRKNELAGTLQKFLPETPSEGAPEPVEVFQNEEVQKPAQEPSGAQDGLQKAVRGLSWFEIIKAKLGRKKDKG